MSGLSREDLRNVSPETARKIFRAGEFFCMETSCVCQGHLQTNLLGLHKSLADDFAKFCEANWGPLPLVFQSDVGQFTAPAITQTESDVRTDLSAYFVIQNGETRIVKNILELGDILDDFVFFYTGCSFSFNKALLDAGVPQQSLINVNTYTTNIDCHPVGPLGCKMVMSARAIPRDLLETTFKVTHEFPYCHGAPVHIGNPALIGITDMTSTIFKCFTFEDGYVPVFWACGITDLEVVKSAKPALAVAQVEGLYIADEPSHIRRIQDGSSAGIKVISLTKEPYWASVTSEAIVLKIRQLEGLITKDLDKQQIGNVVVPGGLLKSTLALSHASSVAVVTRLPSNTSNNGSEVFGAIAVVRMLQALGKEVDVVVDERTYKSLTVLLEELLEQKELSKSIRVVQFPPEGKHPTLETARSFLLKAGDGSPRYDHLLAIERASNCHANITMESANNLHQLFVAAGDLPTVTTSSVMSYSVLNNIDNISQEDKANGSTDSASDFKITTRLSSLGCYAAAVALYLVSTCPIHDRYKRRAVGFPPSEEDCKRFKAALSDVEREERMLRILIDHDFYDMKGTDIVLVDGLSFPDVHSMKIQQLRSVVEDK